VLRGGKTGEISRRRKGPTWRPNGVVAWQWGEKNEGTTWPREMVRRGVRKDKKLMVTMGEEW